MSRPVTVPILGREVGTGVAGTSVGEGVGDGGGGVGVGGAGTSVGKAVGDAGMDCPAQPITASSRNKAPRGQRWVFTKALLL